MRHPMKIPIYLLAKGRGRRFHFPHDQYNSQKGKDQRHLHHTAGGGEDKTRWGPTHDLPFLGRVWAWGLLSARGDWGSPSVGKVAQGLKGLAGLTGPKRESGLACVIEDKGKGKNV